MSEETIQTGTEQPSPQPGPYQSYSNGEYEVESNVRTSEEIRENFEKSEPENKDAPKKTEEERKAEDTSKAASELAKRGAEKRQEQPKEEKPEAKEAKPEEEKPKPRKDPNARVQQVTREMAELRREHEATKRELERLKATRAEVPSGDDPKPKAADYPDTPEGADDYIEAKARWAARQERRAEREREAKASDDYSTRAKNEEREQYIQKKVAVFRDKLRAGIKTDPEWENRVKDFAATHPPTWVLRPDEKPTVKNYMGDDIILNQPNPFQLMDYLAQHPDELEELESIKIPRQFHRKLDALSLKLENETPVQVEAEPSKARPPIKPVTGSAQLSDPYELSDKLSDDEWMDRRMALAKKRR